MEKSYKVANDCQGDQPPPDQNNPKSTNANDNTVDCSTLKSSYIFSDDNVSVISNNDVGDSSAYLLLPNAAPLEKLTQQVKTISGLVIMGNHKRTQLSKASMSDEACEKPSSSRLGTLGLQSVGNVQPQQQPLQILNRRGKLARIRKPNPLFYGENIINDYKSTLRGSFSRKAASKVTLKSSSKMLKKSKGNSLRDVPSKGHVYQKKHKVTEHSKKLPPTEKACSTANSGSSPLNSTLKIQNKMATMVDTERTTTFTTATPCTTAVMLRDKSIVHGIASRFHNLLKLPKAFKWVIFEMFYSFIDKALFEGEDKYTTYLAEKFPNLRTKKLTRSEWQKIRSFIGKPRRCSSSFFKEERRKLEYKRQMIHYMQSHAASDEIKDMNFFRDLPNKIPLQLPLGTKVSARLRKPQNGIFSGKVVAVDSATSTYHIKFDKRGLGAQFIPDYEIMSENFHEILPIQQPMAQHNNQNDNSDNNNGNKSESSAKISRSDACSTSSINLIKSEPFLVQKDIGGSGKNSNADREYISGYSRDILKTIVKLKQTLKFKQYELQRLSNMNKEANIIVSQQFVADHDNKSYSSSDQSKYMNSDNATSVPPGINEERNQQYGSILGSLEKINRDLQDDLKKVHEYARKLAQGSQVQGMLSPLHSQEECIEAAESTIQRYNQGLVTNKKLLNLIREFAIILYVISYESTENPSEISNVLKRCIEKLCSNV